MVVRLDAPQPTFTLPSIDEIPDEVEDQPEPGLPLETLGPFRFPALVFGAASFSYQYNNDDHLASFTPVRTVRLALRYGICSFDTSAYYGPSEIVLGTALKTLQEEFPRSSYKLTTKCGRYGATAADFDYSPATIRASVKRSLARLNTEYLDAVYLHDVEFVCTPVGPNEPGENVIALNAMVEAYGLARDDEGKIWGEGDRKILEAVAELRKMQEEGFVKHVGITGYPLHTLLRIALLIRHNPPYKPLDLILSYCHLTLQNDTLEIFGPLFRDRAQVQQVLNASPLSMGLLTPSPPLWHPAPRGIIIAAQKACTVADSWVGALPNLALGYTVRQSLTAGMPLAVGYSSPHEVHESIRVWRQIRQGADDEGRRAKEVEVAKVFEEDRLKNYSWACP
jgi:aryl-alcohol dehydrogenase-like predicted oxidoreductase